jgi:protein-tyrosine-phosphatase
MAEALFRDMVVKNPALSGAGIEVRSAGTLAGIDSSPASDKAIHVMGEHGLDISSHRARQIDGDVVDWADIILVMEYGHKDLILTCFEGTGEKVHLLTKFVGEDGDVFDPIGCGVQAYRDCAKMLQSLIKATIDRITSGE